MDIEDFKTMNPAYKDVPNDILASKIYDKYYKGNVDKEKYLDTVMPKAGWMDVEGNALARGLGRYESGLAVGVGGIAHAIGATGASDTMMDIANKLSERKETYKPEGRQSTAQKIVGGVTELAPGLAATAGEVAPFAVVTALSKIPEGETNPGKLAIEGGTEYAQLSAPMSFGKSIPVKVATGAATQAGIATTGLGAEAFFLSGEKDEKSQKEAAEILHQFFPNVAASTIMGAGGAYLDAALRKVGSAAVNKFMDWLQKDGKDTPTAKKVAESKPAVNPADQVNEKPVADFGDKPNTPPPASPPPVPPVAGRPPKVKTPKQAKAEKKAVEESKKAAQQAESDAFFKKADEDWQQPAPAQETTVQAPTNETVDEGQPIQTQENAPKEPVSRPVIHEYEQYKDVDGAEPVSSNETTLNGNGQLVGKPKPVSLMRGDRYSNAVMSGLTNFDRIALAMTGRGHTAAERAKGAEVSGSGSHSGESFASTTHTPEDLRAWAEGEGLDPHEMAAYGEALIAEAKRQHAENVKAGWGDGSILPLYPHGRPKDKTAGDVVAESVPEKVAEIVEESKKEPAPEDMDRQQLKKLKKQIGGNTIFAKSMRNLYSELKAAGGVHPSIAKALNIDPKKFPAFFSENGKTLDGLQEWMREKGREWISESDAAHADNVETGDAKELALQLMSDELHGMLKKGSHLDGTRAVHPEDKVRIREREALQEYVEHLTSKLSPVQQGVAAVGLLSAADDAKADDGSDTETSRWLTYAGIAVGVGLIYKNKEFLADKTSPAIRDFIDSLRGKSEVVETGAKDIVDAWQGWLAKSSVAAIRQMNIINSISPKMDLASLLANHKFVSGIQYIADMVEQARWKDANKRGMFIGSALDHWDLEDKATKDVYDAYRTALKNDRTPDMKQGEFEEYILDRFPMFRYDSGVGGIRAGLSQGMKFKGDTSGRVFSQYAISAIETIAQGKQIQDLKALKLPSGAEAMRQYKGDGYREIGESWGGTLHDFEGWYIHNSLVNDFKLTFKTYEPSSAIVRTIMGINLAAKRSNVSASGFHLASLWQGKAGDVMGRLLTGELPSMDWNAIDDALRAYDEGGTPVLGTQDALQLIVGKGMRLDAPLEAVTGKESLYHALDTAGKMMDNAIPLSGSVARGVKEIDKVIQKYTWDRTHTGLKIMTALKEFERQQAKFPEKDLNKIAEEVAEYTNDVYGSIDWRRIGYQMTTRYGRAFAADLFSGKGQFLMNLALFAPDWLFATSRTWLNVLPKMKDGKPSFDAKNALYARYLIGSAMAMYTIGEGLNYALSGHDMTENEPDKKDPTIWERIAAKTMVDMGDGRFLVISKHYTDFPTIGLKGGQEATNKLGVAPAALLEMVSNKEYLGSKYAPPITYAPNDRFYLSPQGMEDLSKFLGKKVTPISLQAMMKDGELTQEDLVQAGLGAIGVHVLGYTPDQKETMKETEKARKEEAESGD